MYRSGLVPTVYFLSETLHQSSNLRIYRCRAWRENLDEAPDGGRRNREHTDLMVEMLELGVLWTEFGIVGDVIVSSRGHYALSLTD
jgi:hypothetical protein